MAENETNLSDRQELFRMLRELIRILDLVIYERYARIPEELLQPLRVAWDDFHERHQNRIFKALEAAPEFDNELSGEQRERGLMSLEGVGLTGPHLQVKSLGFWNASRRYILRRALKELQNFLGWADIWLESLTKVIKVSEILVELKKVIEKALDMLNEEGRKEP
jgi:hypothetical protein